MVERNAPALNPVLKLSLEPVPDDIEARGKNEETTKKERLERQQNKLEWDVRTIEENGADEVRHGGDRLLLSVQMFGDSLAPTHRPNDLLPRSLDCKFVAPTFDGYLVEIGLEQLSKLADLIARARSWPIRSDISRVKSISVYGSANILGKNTIEGLWDKAVEGTTGRYFTAWLLPYADDLAREHVLEEFGQLVSAGTILTLEAPQQPSDENGAIPATRPALPSGSVARAMRSYRRTGGVGRATVEVESLSALQKIVASGSVFRIDAARPLRVETSNTGAESNEIASLPERPVVAVIDGGMDDQLLKDAEAWIVPPLVSDLLADRQHGNAVSSLVAHSQALNPDLILPGFGAKFGTLQAVPRRGSNAVLLEDDLLDALTHMALRHRDARVWNMSFNYEEADEPDFVSSLGHDISALARANGCLPVISAGNVRNGQSALLPPADSEAALTVGGRESTKKGKVGNHCAKCCEGPGPQGMLKPEVSGHSTLRVFDGSRMAGTSFPTAVISSLAAHGFENIREATPDLVKALLINRTGEKTHQRGLGWGTPDTETAPWECPPGVVTLLWTGELKTGFNYHWDDIPIPDGMLDGEKIKGEGALTAVLQPLVSPFGMANYFSSRIEVALQHRTWKRTEDGIVEEWSNLLGTMRESTIAETEARAELAKWNPVRHHKREMKGITTRGSDLRVRARVYTRDLYQATLPDRSSVPPQKVALVLSLRSPAKTSSAYDSVVRKLGAFVESAVVQQDITVEGESDQSEAQ
ncbi:MAG: S8 family serine peptidase [Pseudomonadota bacterium]